MFYILHFDRERHIGLIEENGAQWLAIPPYTENNMRQITSQQFKFDEIISRAATIDKALFEVRCEAHIHVLDTISNLWLKQASGSAVSLSVDKSRNLLLKHFEAAQSNSTLLNADYDDIHSFRLCLGLSNVNLAKIQKNMPLMQEAYRKKLNYLLTHEYNDWSSDKDLILDYINRVLLPGKRLREAKNTILAMKVHCKELSSKNIQDIDNYLPIISKNIMAESIENGDQLAKPWQKYAKTNAGFKYRKQSQKKQNDEDQEQNSLPDDKDVDE
jgi:hypothetical protein